MSYITSNDGIRLLYKDTGHGRPLVLIPGWTFSERFFYRNVGALAATAHVITVGLYGRPV
jgi:pimeloyl-ACP methyl ester carboxylesterase